MMKTKGILTLLLALGLTGGFAWWWTEGPLGKAVAITQAKPNAVVAATAGPKAGAKVETDSAAEVLPKIPVGYAPGPWNAVLQLKSGAARNTAFAKLIAALKSPNDWRLAMAFLQDNYARHSEVAKAWGAAWAKLAAADPQTCLALLAKLDKKQKGYAAAVIPSMEPWGATDPEAAIRWLDANTSIEGGDLDAALQKLVIGYAKKDPTAAANYALSVVKDRERNLLGPMTYAVTTEVMKRSGPAGTQQWFHTLPEDAKFRFWGSVGNRLGEKDREAQRQWLDAGAGSFYRDDDAYTSYVQYLAKTEPRAAAEYVLSLQRNDRTGTYVPVGRVAIEWMQKRPTEFMNYVQAMPAGIKRDRLFGAIYGGLMEPNFPKELRPLALEFVKRAK